jgi:hypothetical protein
MPPILLIVVLTISLLGAGCKKEGTPPPAPRAGPAAAEDRVAEWSEADLESVLAGLTQALRKFCAEKRQVPASLNELVAAGYVKGLPPPPRGKHFAIDRKTLKVILK